VIADSTVEILGDVEVTINIKALATLSSPREMRGHETLVIEKSNRCAGAVPVRKRNLGGT
jgi:hypothetical protein